jgi:hypothetical protein
MLASAVDAEGLTDGAAVPLGATMAPMPALSHRGPADGRARPHPSTAWERLPDMRERMA